MDGYLVNQDILWKTALNSPVQLQFVVIFCFKSNRALSKNQPSPPRRANKQPLIYLVLLLVLLGSVTRPLVRGALFYQNFWGGAVFVPFALLVVALIVVVIVIKSNRR